ncbi:hypothetical protein RRG08_051496 [Elysia crispata]|uniref:Uncharacterized protein n=1 Tax=Elysia crispata TaxID=231223 RepID=A0AAE0Z671_9GAST|nr:hypothetical protein RRG08_051496 [Elysia crispata]
MTRKYSRAVWWKVRGKEDEEKVPLRVEHCLARYLTEEMSRALLTINSGSRSPAFKVMELSAAPVRDSRSADISVDIISRVSLRRNNTLPDTKKISNCVPEHGRIPLRGGVSSAVPDGVSAEWFAFDGQVQIAVSAGKVPKLCPAPG